MELNNKLQDIELENKRLSFNLDNHKLKCNARFSELRQPTQSVSGKSKYVNKLRQTNRNESTK